jgi:5-methylcytosine-specific restriction endonuclease McrA
LAEVTEEVLRTLGRRESDLAKEIGETLRYRTLFVLLPEACIHFDLPEMKPVIRTHLTSLGVDPASRNFEDLVSAIKTICECIRTKIAGQGRKLGVSDVYHTFPSIYKRIMAEQGNRCRYCGVPLIYGDNLTLDHVAPWHIGGDPQDGSNWAFSCQDCNAGKDWWPYYSLHCTGFNWLDPRNSVELRKAARYGALVRDGVCTRTGVGPSAATLAVVKRVPSGCW